MPNILILGGTTEASALAMALAGAGLTATLSYAGRVESPRAQPVATRIGGFGGPEGLADHLRRNHITHLVDATHPFAAQISRNAVLASAATGTPLIALERAAWQPQPGDRWTRVADTGAAALALAGPPRRVFLAIGRQHLGDFAGQPQHHYLLRLVDPPNGPLPLPHTTVILARGPFDLAGDIALLLTHEIDTIIAKNAGGAGAEAKILAARQRALPVVMIERPTLPPRRIAGTIADVMGWIAHTAPSGTDRGV